MEVLGGEVVLEVDGFVVVQTESTNVPQFDGHRFRLISGLSLIGSMMDQSATVKSMRSDTLIRTRFVESPARCLSCRM